jgi:hypothetical protein
MSELHLTTSRRPCQDQEQTSQIFLRPSTALAFGPAGQSPPHSNRKPTSGQCALPHDTEPVGNATFQGYHIGGGLSNPRGALIHPLPRRHRRHPTQDTPTRSPVRGATRGKFTTALEGCQIPRAYLSNHAYMDLRPSNARVSVTSSVYSRSPPTGRPRARRVTLMPLCRSC